MNRLMKEGRGERTLGPEEMGQCLEGCHPFPIGWVLQASGPAPTLTSGFLRPSVSFPSARGWVRG